MRIKIFVIITLILAILTAATSGTLSHYTASMNGAIGMVPDKEKIESMYYTNPSDILRPDYSSLPNGVDVFGTLIISNSSITITNIYGFVAFTGNITRTKPNPKLIIGKSNDNYNTYLVYFEQGTKIYFDDGSHASFGGFYLVDTGLNILDDSLYTKQGTVRTLKSLSSLRICTEIAEIALAYGIPLMTAN
ncbi:MAG: hypothetical protein CVU97_02160 [Firmicutes bacterium HGW-Firmicutes-21]|nr:MAG: hypothetical protein CVU97_02160 [Firmicutes bacterium HGW-Firmicutes-21]